MTPAISVLMPARDASALIGDALCGLRAQTFGDFEIVLVDDGSTDETVATARRTWGEDQRLRVVTQPPLGLIPALVRGLAECRAPLIARMDADDRVMPERLALQHAYLHEHPDVTIVGTQVRTFANGGVGQGYRLFDAWQNALVAHEEIVREMFIESPLSHPSVTFRAEALRGLGGYRDPGWPEDYDLWHRAREAGLRFAKIAAILIEGRDDPGRTSRVDPRYGLPAMLRCKAHYLARGPLRDRKPVICGAGRIGRRLARALEAEGCRPAAFIDVDARKQGRDVGGLLVYAPAALRDMRERTLLAAVGSRGARDEIRKLAARHGWREGEDFHCVA